MTNREAVLETIEASSGTCDVCLGQLTGIRPHQQINQIANHFVSKGLVNREPGSCPRCGNQKRCLNLAKPREQSLGRPRPVHQNYMDLDVFHRTMIKQLKEIDQDRIPYEGFSATVTRLRDGGTLIKDVASLMLAHAGFRNLVHHEAYCLTTKETMIVQLLQEELRERFFGAYA